MSDTLKPIDHAALRVNQAVLILFCIAGYVLNFWLLVAFTAFMMSLGTLIGKPAFAFVYHSFLKPLRLTKPDIVMDTPQSHRFAQGLGAGFLILAVVALLAGWTVAGWLLTGLVVLLAALNLFTGFCVGCFFYFQLSKLKFFRGAS
jgi:cytosine/uracil/thiamine/allantoin permease